MATWPRLQPGQAAMLGNINEFHRNYIVGIAGSF